MESEVGVEEPATKKPRVEDEEAKLLMILRRYRHYWGETLALPKLGPKRYTESGPPLGGTDYEALEIFSLKVTEIKEGLEWPLRVFGLIAVRDSLDHKRNILFHHGKENCQTLIAE
ncbi:hypothetical protein ACP70R_038165 [Stipagrostis hirtigluma subsp. patula]